LSNSRRLSERFTLPVSENLQEIPKENPARFKTDWNRGSSFEIGDGVDSTIATRRDAAGQLFVNGGVVPINGGQATVANTATIQVLGQGGNDTIALEESNGALPAAQLFGVARF